MDALKNMIGPDFLFFMLTVVLGYLYAVSSINESKLKTEVSELNDALRQIEEQTRLIIKTDLELSQIQEELDKQLASFKSLQNISQITSSLLQQDQIFDALTENLISDLGFGFFSVVLTTPEGAQCKKLVGYADRNRMDEFFTRLQDKDFFDVIGRERLLISDAVTRIPDYVRLFLENEVKLTSYIVCALRSKSAVLGAVFFGNFGNIPLQEGLREIVEIFVTQLAQAMENIEMFEEIYHSKRELELRVKERTRDLEKALADLESANRRKTEFVSAVSHEFRTPLTSIKGYAALLVKGKFGELADDIKTRLNRINDQADSLVAMINDLLDIARIESGRVQITIQPIDVADLIRGEAEMFYPQLQEKNLKLQLQIPERAVLPVDKKLIQRVTLNLLSNAIKFTPEGRNIYLTMEEEAGAWRISVKDEGIGVPAADVENVFKEFFRVDTAEHKAVKGTGLGLSLVHNIIKAHKGEVWVESDLGKGAKFIFTLPKQQDLFAAESV